MDREGKRKLRKPKVKGRKSGLLTPQLIVVAAALRCPAAVSGLTGVALVVHAFTVQEALPERSRNVFSTSQLSKK